MNNIERSDLLFDAASECAEHARSSFSRRKWNMAIRRAQEAVELELTGMLALIGAHYPKDHDQAPLLFRMLSVGNLGTESQAKEVERISADLSRKRGPALHQEEGYDKETAQRAIAEVEYVLGVTAEIKRQIKK